MAREQLKIARTHAALESELIEFAQRGKAETDAVIRRLLRHFGTGQLAEIVEQVTGDPSV